MFWRKPVLAFALRRWKQSRDQRELRCTSCATSIVLYIRSIHFPSSVLITPFTDWLLFRSRQWGFSAHEQDCAAYRSFHPHLLIYPSSIVRTWGVENKSFHAARTETHYVFLSLWISSSYCTITKISVSACVKGKAASRTEYIHSCTFNWNYIHKNTRTKNALIPKLRLCTGRSGIYHPHMQTEIRLLKKWKVNVNGAEQGWMSGNLNDST